MKTKIIILISSVILTSLFVFSSNGFANNELKGRYITPKKESEKPTLKSKENPVAIKSYMKQRGTWKLLNVDSVKYDSEGRLIESFLVGEDVREKISYDKEGNKTEVIITKKGVNDEKKVYKYDDLKKNYRTEQIHYIWKDNNWLESYHHIKRIERNADNEIKSIKIYTVGGPGDTALNSSYFINYGSDGRASEFYSVNNYEGINDTTESYSQMRWAKWEGQLTEGDFLDKNALESAIMDETLEDPGVMNCIFNEDGYIRRYHYDLGFFLENQMIKLENDGFINEFKESLVKGTDSTLVVAEKITEENDVHGNIILSKLEVFEGEMPPIKAVTRLSVNPSPKAITRLSNGSKAGEIAYELFDNVEYVNKYDEKDRFVESVMVAYDMETQKSDTVEKTEFIYSDLSSEKVSTIVSNLVYPNPAKESINVSTNEQFDVVHICDMSGRIVLRYKFSENSSYDISSLKSGFYVIKLIGKKNHISSKFAVL